MTTIDIKPIKLGEEFWVMVIMDEREVEWHGPFASGDAAEATAAQLRQVSRALRAQVHV